MIVQELREIQERCGYLPEEELRLLADRINEPLHRLHEVASFYPLYRMKPPAKVEVEVCRDMACHLRGAPRLTQSLDALGHEIGGGQVCVKGVSCLGQCDFAPAVVINDHVYRGKTDAELNALVESAAANEKLPHQHADSNPLGWKIDVYNASPTYHVAREYIKNPDAEALIEKLKVSALRGMGGAGFPTFLKWSAVRSIESEVKYVVCNADESEPGTFKDRELIRRAPHLLIEGMLLAGLVTGATQGYMYIRHEYHEEERAFAKALEEAKAQGLLGDRILGSNYSFHLEIYVSPGGYIQGEESALLEAIEDRRGEPRNKPPFPTVQGLFNKPTVINNVETLSWVPGIVMNGGEWYRDQGVRDGTGMRFVSISGDVKQPGVYEVPFGQTVYELIFETAGGMRDGQHLKAIATSGPSGGFLPAHIKLENLPENFVKDHVPAGSKTYDVLQLPLDLKTFAQMGGMLGAAFVVYGDHANMVEQALNCVQFYRNESCGKCVPCRLGSQKLVDMIGDILAGKLPREKLLAISELSTTMGITSICGLGQVAANPLTSVMKHFPEELDRYIHS